MQKQTLLAEDGMIIVEASLETDFSYAEELGYFNDQSKRNIRQISMYLYLWKE